MTPKGMPKWSLGGIDFNTGEPDADGVLWVIEEEEGFWGSVNLSNSYTSKLNQHGSYWVPGFKTRDVITLTCSTYVPGSKYDYPSLRRAMMKAAALCSDPTRLYPLVCHAEIGAMYASVTLDGDILTKPRYVDVPAFEWSIQLSAPDPRRYSMQEQVSETNLPSDSLTGLDFKSGTNGLDFETTGGLNFGSGGATGAMILENHGTAPTQPVFTLYGPLETPTLAVGSGSLTYNDTLDAGEFIVIDPSDPSCLLGGNANRSYLLNPANFQAFTIPANGSLNVGLSHTGLSSATGYVRATYRHAWF